MKARIFTLPLHSVMATLILSTALSAQSANASPARYGVIDLGTLGGSFSLGYAINDKGQVDGFSTLPGDQTVHSFVVESGSMIDLGTLGGPNSQSFSGLNNVPQVGGSSDTATSDPNGEDFCFFGTNLICLGFVWQNNVMTPLGTLGGNNSQVSDVNQEGEVTGYAETSAIDLNCPKPQVLQFLPATWTNGNIKALPLYGGDADGAAFWINNNGDPVGASGDCAPYDGRYGAYLEPRHALLWRSGGAVDLGNLGGQINNAAFAINDRGQIVGGSDLPGDNYQHAFLWSNGVMTDLGTLQGDVVSAALSINNRGQVVGVSQDADQDNRAFLWQNGVMYDLNTLIPANSPLYLLHAFGINNSGEIAGMAYNTITNEIHAVKAVPVRARPIAQSGSAAGDNGRKVELPANARKLLDQYLHLRGIARTSEN